MHPDPQRPAHGFPSTPPYQAAPPSSQPAPRRGGHWWLWAGLGAVVLVGAVAVAYLAGRSGTEAVAVATAQTVNGDLAARSCVGYGGYGDINPGASVTIYDAGGRIVGTGTLGAGVPNKQPGSLLSCVFPFSVSGVPTGGDFYSIEVSHRGKVTFTAQQISSGDVHLSIGGS